MSSKPDPIRRIQSALRERQLPGWLFYGFHNIDPTALRILGFPPHPHITRRWFYLVPDEGEPRKLVHRIESSQLDHLAGKKSIYLTWTELDQSLTKLLAGIPKVAMQYSEKNAIPYVSRVDAGTVEWVRSRGVEVVSSGDLVQLFESVLSPTQMENHRTTAQHLTRIVQDAFSYAAQQIAGLGQTSEIEVQRFILSQFEAVGLVTEHLPIVGVGRNSGDPHYSPTEATSAAVRENDFLLIDLWAKTAAESAVYADITWTAFLGSQVPSRIEESFGLVTRARDRGIRFIGECLASGVEVQGWEVDDEVRQVMIEAGKADFFVHRTGHNLGQEVHGNGVHFDNLETHDTRTLIPGLAMTVEPGLYFRDFGVRSEINLLIGEREVEVTTQPQTAVLLAPPI